MSMVTVQVDADTPLAGTLLPATVIVALPAAAVTVPPVHVPLTFGAAAITSPLGNVSVKPTVCAGLFAAGLVMVNVSVVEPPALMTLGLNALLSVGVCCAA